MKTEGKLLEHGLLILFKKVVVRIKIGKTLQSCSILLV